MLRGVEPETASTVCMYSSWNVLTARMIEPPTALPPSALRSASDGNSSMIRAHLRPHCTASLSGNMNASDTAPAA